MKRLDTGWWKVLSEEDTGLLNWSCMAGSSKGQRALVCQHNKTGHEVVIMDDGNIERNAGAAGLVCPPIGACKLIGNLTNVPTNAPHF